MSESRDEPREEPRETSKPEDEQPEDEQAEAFVFDEAFIAAAAFKEPSARQRKGSAFARWRWVRRKRSSKRKRLRAERAQRKRQREQQAAWRAAGLTSDPQSAPGGKAKTFAIGFTIVVVTIGLATIVKDQRWGPWANAGDDRTTAEGTGTGTGNGAQAEPVAEPPGPTLKDPFKGSPAENFADGEAGIVTPKPAAMGGFTKTEVAAFYRRSRDLLIAGQLDRRTVFSGRPDAFSKILDPEQRTDFLRDWKKRDSSDGIRTWVTVLAPRSAEAAGSVIKVKGTTTAKVVSQSARRGVLVKHNYLVVYPVYRPGRPETLTRVVAHVQVDVFSYRENGGPHSWVSSMGGFYTPVECGTKDGYVHPVYPEERFADPDGVAPTGPEVDPYDLTPEKAITDCQRAKKT